MYLKQLWLYQYKNHEQLSFDFTDGINAIYGANGIGKTNVLDAIHYLCNGKSYFTNADSKVISKGKNELSVKGIFVLDDMSEYEVIVKFGTESKKTIHQNQKRLKRLQDHIGHYPVVMVTPTDVRLIYDDSKERRRFMDLVLCQVDTQYLYSLSSYNKALDQRNKVLKQMKEKGIQDPTILDAYTQKLIAPGQLIADIRKEFINEFTPLFQKAHQSIAKQESEISFEYKSHINEENNLKRLLADNKNLDLAAGRTTKGVHKDDLLFLLSQEPIKQFASQGQIKTFLIALKVAKFDYLYSKTGKKPLLLLDDIFEKIDEERAQHLMELVGETHFGQIFLSDTHQSRIKKHLQDLNTSIKSIPLENG
jgi:DNA replication and repair protein RecF